MVRQGVDCRGSLQYFVVIYFFHGPFCLCMPGSCEVCNSKVNSFQSYRTLQVWLPLCCRWLDNNYLRGQIPPGFCQLKKLASLRLSDTLLSGSIPLCILALPKPMELVVGNPHVYTMKGGLNLFPCAMLPTSASRKVKPGKSLLSTSGSDLSSPPPGGYTLSPLPDGTSSPAPALHSNIGAIAGAVAGAVVLVSITLVLVCLSLHRAKRLSSGQSDTGSSDPSAQVDWVKRPDSPLIGIALPTVSEVQRARRFALSELEHATKHWNPTNLIGEGGFGLVYKGLLEDGAIVAIKKRTGSFSQDFATEVDNLSRVHHKHLVILIGYCQENDQQMVVYDYLPNGSVSSHLYDANGCCLGKLDFKQRISIALGAAKGLEYLHSLVPPLVHIDFKTSNVLVDENFVSKVTDYGLSRLLLGEKDFPLLNRAGTEGFLDPEFFVFQRLSEKSDVYSFGVFLLELISGREAISTTKPRPEWSLVEWARSLLEERNLGALVDVTLGGNFTEDGIRTIVEMSFQCIEPKGDKRPCMKEIVRGLDEILEKESAEGTAFVALGSELFLRRD